MFLGLYLLTALSLTVLLIYRAEWGVLAAAAILPVTPSLPDTEIPAFNVTNIMICAMAVGVFARRTPRDQAGPASRNVFPAARQLAVFSIVVLWGWVNVTFIQKVPDVPTHRFNPYDALWSLKDLGTLGALTFITYRSSRRIVELPRQLLLLVVGSAVEVVSCVLEWIRTGDRIDGHVQQVNSLATYLALAGSAGAALFLGAKGKGRWLGLLVSGGAIFDCIQPRSRRGILALFFGILVVTLIRSRGLFVILLVTGLSYRLWMPAPVLERFDEAYTVDARGSMKVSDTAAKRVEIWKAGLRALEDHPLGVGLTAYRHYSGGYGTKGVEASQADVDMTAHNEFISLAVELSPLGLIAFLVLLAALGRSAVRCYAGGEGANLKAVGLAGLGMLAAACLANVSGTFFFDAATMGPFWMVAGLSCRGESLLRERPAPGPAAERTPLAQAGGQGTRSIR